MARFVDESHRSHLIILIDQGKIRSDSGSVAEILAFRVAAAK
jgi:hypothetical protein